MVTVAGYALDYGMNSLVPDIAQRPNFRCITLFLLLGLSLVIRGQAQTPAFPGALGFGANATGGRAGSVYHVTTLADSGTGSFRTAVSSGNRIIVFDVGGYINLQTAVSCSSGLTIAGQTAPGGGIGIMGAEVSFYGRNNIICRHVRFRQGDIHNGSNSSNQGESALSLGADTSTSPATNMIFDHISVGFGSWDSVDAVNTAFFTVQNSIIADPIYQRFGAHHEGDSASWIRNLWVNGHNRQPLAKANTIYINNVIYNYQAGYTCGDTGGFFSHDIINNYFITGPSTSSAGDDFYQIDANQSTYAYGNLRDSDNNGALGGSTTDPNEGGPVLTAPWSPVTMTIPTYSTVAAYRIDVSLSGTFPHDQVDAQVIGNVTSLGTAGQMFNSEGDTGLGNSGYGIINGGVAAIDTDGDGMPDYWEKAVGLNPNNASDAMTIASDGYANIEHYLNWLADPHALTGTNAPVDIDLWQYTGGFTNAGPVYVLSGASNGVVVLNSGHVAHFTPTLNFSGLGGFQFTVTANDGTSFTNWVNVLMTPITPPSNLVWQGDGIANVWTNGGPANWSNGTNLVAFASGDNVTFDDTGSSSPAINLSGPISAGTVYVIADNQNYTFGGSGYLAGGSVLFKTGAGQLTLDTTNTATGGVTINEGTVQIGDGVAFNGGLAGNVTNNDTLIYATPGTLASAVNISGSGTLTETGPGTLTLSGTQTYSGPTAVNAGALTLSGSLPPSDITNNGSLTLAPTAWQNYSNALSGPGTVSINASGVLALTGTNTFTGDLTNNSGFLILSNNQAAGLGTVVYIGGYVVPANGVVITNNFNVPASAASDLNMMATNSGTAIWAGNVVMGGSAQWRPGSDGGTLEFVGNAVQGNHIFIVPRGAVIFASNSVASSTVSGFLGRDGSANKRSSNITIRDNASVAMAGCSLGGGKVGGSVTITVQNNGTLAFGANTVDLHNIANTAAISTLRLNGGSVTAGGFTKTQTTYTNIIEFNGGILRAGAANAAFLPAFNFTTNAVQAGGAIIDDGGFAISILAPLIHDPALGATMDGGLTKLDTGTLTLTNACTYTGPTFIEGGTLVIYASAGTYSIRGSGSIYVGAGAVLDTSEYSTLGWYFDNKQMFWGNGSVKGNVTIGAPVILAPGSNAIGTLTFSNALTLASGCTNIFKISPAPLTNDSVTVYGSLTNGGTLIVTNIGGAPLAANDTFNLFSAASFNGTFSSVQLPSLPVGLIWNTNSLNRAGTVSVALNTAPVIGAISISGNSLGLSGTGGVGNANFILLGATNLAASIWTPLLTNQFDSGGNFNFTNGLGTNEQNYYRLQLAP
jgi:autotransporter-associated beta strand protein